MDVAGDPSVMVFALTGGSPNTRQAIATYTPPYLPYFHSFGVHEDFALTIHQPVTVDFKVVEKTGILGNAFVDLSLNGTKNQFYILPFGDAAGTVEIYNSSESFFHLHTLNMFYGENSTVVVDCEVYDKFLFTNPTLTVPGSTNKTIRDGYSNFGGIKRFIIDRKAGTVSEGKKFSADKTFTTFPVINNKYHGKRYCIYYATEMFHNHVEFGSYAIVKMNICTGKRSYWFEEGHFQSEATFVPSKVPDADEDAGVLVFIDLHGATGNSSLITLNAKTMKTTSTTPLPARVPFTLHGEWYN
jgi:carotenoid cleavage dioxygenase-like enzyme